MFYCIANHKSTVKCYSLRQTGISIKSKKIGKYEQFHLYIYTYLQTLYSYLDLSSCSHQLCNSISGSLIASSDNQSNVWFRKEKKKYIFNSGLSIRSTSCCLQHLPRAPAFRAGTRGRVLSFPSPAPFLAAGCRGMAIDERGGVLEPSKEGWRTLNNIQRCEDQQNGLHASLFYQPMTLPGSGRSRPQG